MSPPKGKVPAHIKPKLFDHPGKASRIISTLCEAEDPRQPSCNFHHSLVSIIFISLAGILCGAKDWEEVVQAANGMLNWIRKYVDLPSGVPSSKTLKRVMSLIPTESLGRLLDHLKTGLVEGDIIAIDGKTLRGSRGWNELDQPLHLLHAWSTDLGVCLGQASVDEKSNEITDFPKLIERLELKGTIVTADALHTQKKAVSAIVKQKADYVLPVKGNHKDLYEDIKFLFEDADQRGFIGIDAAESRSQEKSGGRVEERSYQLLDIESLSSVKEWSGCSSVGRVIRKRTKKGKTSIETCYYITSLDLDVDKFARSARGHWGVENGLHLSLDVIFEEDKHRYQDKIGAANLSLLRKVALAVLTKDTTLKCGKSAKQMRAATSFAYRDHLIKNCF